MSELIRIFNLTDVTTEKLEQHKLVNQTIVVGRVLVPPGGMAEAENDGMLQYQLRHFISVGALAVGTLPPAYVLAKERAPKSGLVRLPEPEKEPAKEEFKSEEKQTEVAPSRSTSSSSPSVPPTKKKR